MSPALSPLFDKIMIYRPPERSRAADDRRAADAIRRLKNMWSDFSDLDTLRSVGFALASIRVDYGVPEHPWVMVTKCSTGDDLRDRLPELVTLYRQAPEQTAHGVYWASAAWQCRLHTIGTASAEAPIWSMTLDRDDPRLLARIAGSEFIVYPVDLPVQPA